MPANSPAMDLISAFARFASVSYCLLQAVDTVKCVGPSMLPTLNRNGDIVLLDKVTPSFRSVRKGEVVVCKSVSDPRNTVCKRVIAEVRSSFNVVLMTLCDVYRYIGLCGELMQEGDTVCVQLTYARSLAEFHRVRREI